MEARPCAAKSAGLAGTISYLEERLINMLKTIFLALYSPSSGLSAEAASQLAAGKLDTGFLDYDWRLNALAGLGKRSPP